MTKTQTAQQRYTRRMLGSGLCYLAALLGVMTFINAQEPSLAVAIGLSIIPAIFVMGMLVAIWRYLKETDEVQRFFVTRAMMIGLFAVLIVSGGWGLMEMVVDDLPKLPVFWIFPIFFFAMGLSQLFNRDQGCLP